jgi:hypothetical protein
VWLSGFEPKFIVPDSTHGPIDVLLHRDSSLVHASRYYNYDFKGNVDDEEYSQTNDGIEEHGGASYMFDYFNFDFGQFESVIGRENVDCLNGTRGAYGLGFEYYRKHSDYHMAIGIMGSRNAGAEDDSVSIRTNSTHYQFGYGYDIIGSKAWRIEPEVSLVMQKYRLRNYSLSDRVSLEDVLDQRELDLRFYHFFARAGLDLAINLGGPGSPNEGFIFGVKGGYQVPLNAEPFLKTRNVNIRDGREVSFDLWYFGIYLLMGA